MNLQIAPSAFLLGSLAVASVAVAAWDEPQPGVVSSEQGQGICALPRAQKLDLSPAAQPGHNVLLLMFGLSQSLRSSD